MGLNDDFERMDMNDNTRLDHYLVAVTKAYQMSRGNDNEVENVQVVYYNY
jgi:hypothetical protein